ncbi:MAG: NusA antitermination factor [Parcubacteria group bacterium GW2011_GWB1_41_6]|nr:MAG: NusA antitermination factor [Parcubacteria group bacterium GW2011_GWB1_41_6]KKS34286.1 MAG: NusA antitermination factor [Parcubacteria group bacterium GW2011_GWC2_42_13]KKS57809.1 MAG: NusA antitermination factor [Parcubacteria group bacterium GW2011_GWA2_42_35]
MMDAKTIKSALEQLETERGIPKEKIVETIQEALAAAYKKDYGKKGQIIKAEFDLPSGQVKFYQIKIVVDESMLKKEDEEEEEDILEETEETRKIRFNPERHILLEEARKIKKKSEPDDELIFPLETKEDYGRIATQTAKQVIIQKLREAERDSIFSEFKGREGEIVSGLVQRIEGWNIFIDLGRATAVLPKDGQVRGEYYRLNERIKALLVSIQQEPRGAVIYLSRSHPHFVIKLFEIEVPEIINGAVEIKAVAREAGSRTKIAVLSNEEGIDPIGSTVGQKGIRVNTIISELGGEKIDIAEWSDEPAVFIANALSPAKILNVETNEKTREAVVTVAEDQLSLAIGRTGQNVRLAAKLTGWKLDIRSRAGKSVAKTNDEGEILEEE